MEVLNKNIFNLGLNLFLLQINCFFPVNGARMGGWEGDPKVEIEKKGADWSFSSGTNFGGEAEVVGNADGSYAFKVKKFSSNAGDVTKEQGDRALNAGLVEMHKIQSERETHFWNFAERVAEVALPILLAPKPIPPGNNNNNNGGEPAWLKWIMLNLPGPPPPQ